MKVFLLIAADEHQGEFVYTVHKNKASAIKMIISVLTERLADGAPRGMPAALKTVTASNWAKVAEWVGFAFEIKETEVL